MGILSCGLQEMSSVRLIDHFVHKHIFHTVLMPYADETNELRKSESAKVLFYMTGIDDLLLRMNILRVLNGTPESPNLDRIKIDTNKNTTKTIRSRLYVLRFSSLLYPSIACFFLIKNLVRK